MTFPKRLLTCVTVLFFGGLLPTLLAVRSVLSLSAAANALSKTQWRLHQGSPVGVMLVTLLLIVAFTGLLNLLVTLAGGFSALERGALWPTFDDFAADFGLFYIFAGVSAVVVAVPTVCLTGLASFVTAVLLPGGMACVFDVLYLVAGAIVYVTTMAKAANNDFGWLRGPLGLPERRER